jgi:hypothetical protein
MEFALNLLWLLLCASSFVLWRNQRSRLNRERRWLALIGLACLLAIVFPIISLTDDLHGEQAAFDDSTFPVVTKGGKGNACSPLQFLNVPACISLPSSPFAYRQFVRLVSPNELSAEPVDRTQSGVSRAPPTA